MPIPEPGCCDTEYDLLRKILLGLPDVGGGTDLAISDEGVQQTDAATSINFVGAGVTASAVGGNVTVSITGGAFFPSDQVVYLDLDFAILGVNAYGTAQTAYVAADALAVASGKPVAIMVGRGSAADFGGITLAADWNASVSMVGLGPDVSHIGLINGQNAAGNSFAVNLTAKDIKINGILTDTLTGPGTTENGGAITVDGDNARFGIQSIYSDIRNGGTGVGGVISLTGCHSVESDLFHVRSGGAGGATTGAAADITITRCRFPGATNGLDAFVDGVAGKASGNVTVIDSDVGYISVEQNGIADQNAGNITLKNSIAHDLYLNAATLAQAGTLTATSSEIRANSGGYGINVLSGSSVLIDCTIKTIDSDLDCILDLGANGATFINCVMDANGIGKEINASVARTIKAFDLKVKNGLHANVTLSEGSMTQSTSIQVP